MELYVTDEFDRKYGKLSKPMQRKVAKALDQIKNNPHSGKPLRYAFFREKKIGKYRIYYLIYEEYLVVFIITFSGKKEQQETIDRTIELLPRYRDEIKKIFFASA